MKQISLSDHFTCGTLLRYSLPAIGESLAETSFQVVDGLFVSLFLGVTPFAAVNIIYPPFMVLYGIGLMFGAGTSALVARMLGEGKRQTGCEIFTLAVGCMTLLGMLLGALAAVCMPLIARAAGASGDTLPYCISYGRLLTAFLPAHLINAAFISLWITAGKAWLGMLVTVINGLGNAFLDWLFMRPLGLGAPGAALATSAAALITACIILVYFFRPNPSALRFVRPDFRHMRQLVRICTNGFSEMVDSITNSLTQMLVNLQLARLFGAAGVAAMGVFNYVIGLFMAVFFGIASTAITVVGYKYGCRDRQELDSLLRKSTGLTLALGLVMCLLCAGLAGPVSYLFLGYDSAAQALSAQVLRISAAACLLYGFDIVTASFFTGLGDGLSSALIAACVSFLAPVGMIYLLPALFGPPSIWFAIPASVAVTAVLCVILLRIQYPRMVSALSAPPQD